MKKQLLLPAAGSLPVRFGNRFPKQALKIFLAIFLIGAFTCVKGQAPLDAVVSFSGNEGYFNVIVPDTNNVHEIEIMVGTDSNASEMFSHIFVYDQVSGLPAGLSYSRSGNAIRFGMGTVTLLPVYHAKARLKNGSGSWSDWYEFIGN